MGNKFSSFVKIYQCLALTVIATALVIIVLRTPVPYTYENIKSGKVKQEQIPITRVTGSVDINNTVTVEVER
jgi:hypothetical protein